MFLLQSTAGYSALAWLMVILMAALFIFGLIYYVHRQRKHRPRKEQDNQQFRR